MRELSIWKQLPCLPFLSLYEKVMYSAMQLDVFSSLEEKITAKELAGKKGWNEANTEDLLSALTALGFLKKEGETYENLPETGRYLVKGSPEYLGDFLVFYGMGEGSVPMDVVKAVTEGPQPMEQSAMEGQLDFEQYGKALRGAQTGYRQKELLEIVRSLPENESILRILDAGCATGLLGLTVIGDNPVRTGVLFDRLPAGLIEESVELCGLRGRAQAVSGDFLTDDIGSGYDLILASGIMLFAKGRMEELLKKFYDALNPGGVVLVIGEGIAKDHTGPWDMVLGYLPYYFQGMDMGVIRGEVEEAARRAGFSGYERRSELLCSGNQDIEILRRGL